MRTARSLSLVAIGLVLLGFGHGALAQQPAASPPAPAQAEALEQIRLTRVGLAALRQTLITEGMDLTPEEMQAFWPLYGIYRQDAIRLGDRIVALILRYADNYDQLTDEAAETLLAEFVSIEQARGALKAAYLPQFRQVLPARKVARFYQLENKLDTLILAELAEQILLAR